IRVISPAVSTERIASMAAIPATPEPMITYSIQCPLKEHQLPQNAILLLDRALYTYHMLCIEYLSWVRDPRRARAHQYQWDSCTNRCHIAHILRDRNQYSLLFY